MKRFNIRDAFVGEPTGADDRSDNDGDEEALVFTVRGGELTVDAPGGTSEDRLLDAATSIRATLRLENERVLSLVVHEGAVGAFFEDESVDLHHRREASGSVGLSSIAGPGYMASRQRCARDVMTSDVITTRPDVPISELTRLLAFHNVSGLPVLDDAGRLVGMVTEADVIGKRGSRVADIMSRDLIAVDENTSLEAIARLMNHHRVKRVLVVQDGALVGLVSRADIVRALAGV